MSRIDFYPITSAGEEDLKKWKQVIEGIKPTIVFMEATRELPPYAIEFNRFCNSIGSNLIVNFGGNEDYLFQPYKNGKLETISDGAFS